MELNQPESPSAPTVPTTEPVAEKQAAQAEPKQAESSLPKITIGDVVRVQTKLKEGEHLRKQRFEGIVIARKGSGISSTFTVRAIIEGYGVERVFPLYSPSIEKVAVIRHEKIRRAKLYYLRRKK